MSPPARTKRPELATRVVVTAVTNSSVTVTYKGESRTFLLVVTYKSRPGKPELIHEKEWVIINPEVKNREWRLTKAT